MEPKSVKLQTTQTNLTDQTKFDSRIKYCHLEKIKDGRYSCAGYSLSNYFF